MALTKVTGQVIRNTTDVTVGVLTVTNTLAVGGTVSVGGTLTYEDVTNVDAVGLITARNGIVVGSGITLSKDGDGFFTGVTTATTFVGALTGNVTGNISGGTVAGSTGTFTGDVDIADKIIHTGDTNTAIRFPAADTVTVETGGSERFRVSSDGKVGVNITDNTTDFHVRNAASPGDASFKMGGSNSTASGLRISYSNSGNTSTIIKQNYRATSADALMEFDSGIHVFKSGTGGDERLRIDSNGLMGLNITPTSHNDTTAFQIHDTYNSQGYPRLRLTNSASGSDSASGFELSIDGNQLSAIVRQRENAGVHVYTNNLERLRVGGNGNVEIGSAAGTGLSYSLLDGLVVNAANGRAGLMVNSSSSDHNAYLSFAYGTSSAEQFNAYVGRVGISTLTFGTNNTIRGAFLDDGGLSVGTLEKSSTSNVALNISGNKMCRLNSFYIGYVPGTSNNSSGVMILHKMGQNIGMQFSGMATIHSYTGSAYLRGCITVRYNTDGVTSSMTTSDGQSGANFQLVSGTISGESGTYFGIKKNGGGTGSFYINAFVAGNIEAYGGIREISNSNWTTDTVHGSGIG